MTQEKEAFGFYFSAHPVDRYRHLATAHRARSFAEVCAYPAPVDGARTGAMMAGLVEDVRWRTSARGRRYAMATISDASGQYIGSCFDDLACADLEEAARNGACVLLTVEMDRKAGEELPRIAVKRVQPFENLAANSRLKGELRLSGSEAIPLLAAELAGADGGRGELIAILCEGRGETRVRLGRSFSLDADLAARLAALPGVESFELSAADPPRLALVS